MAERVQITKLLRTFMIATGSWRFKLTNDKFIQTAYNIYSVIVQCSLFIFLFMLVMNLPSLLKRQNFELIAENIGYTITLVIILAKAIICQTSKIGTLIERCNKEGKRRYEEAPEPVQANFEKKVKVLNRLILVLLTITIFIGITFTYAKYSEFAKYQHFNVTFDKPLPLPVWFPFDPNYYYGTAFGIGISYALLACSYNVVTQALFLTLMTYALSQLKALQIYGGDFHLYCEPYDENNESSKDIVVSSYLRQLVVKHRSVISFVKELNNAIKNVLLLEFLLNSINIASAMVQILMMPNAPLMAVFCVAFFIIQIVQLFLLAWHGNEIEIQSLLFADALFESKWYEQGEKAKRIISIMHCRARRPLRVFIGPFKPMNIDTAINAMKAAYSYATMIFTLANEG